MVRCGRKVETRSERRACATTQKLRKIGAKSLKEQPQMRVAQRPKDQKQDVDNAVQHEIFEAVGQVAVLQKNVTK